MSVADQIQCQSAQIRARRLAGSANGIGDDIQEPGHSQSPRVLAIELPPVFRAEGGRGFWPSGLLATTEVAPYNQAEGWLNSKGWQFSPEGRGFSLARRLSALSRLGYRVDLLCHRDLLGTDQRGRGRDPKLPRLISKVHAFDGKLPTGFFRGFKAAVLSPFALPSLDGLLGTPKPSNLASALTEALRGGCQIYLDFSGSRFGSGAQIDGRLWSDCQERLTQAGFRLITGPILSPFLDWPGQVPVIVPPSPAAGGQAPETGLVGTRLAETVLAKTELAETRQTKAYGPFRELFEMAAVNPEAKILITESDLKKTGLPPGEYPIPRLAILTPLAKEAAGKLGLTLMREGENG
ncbi:MAG: hypothetical protein LBJ61_07680 [Deltaproteobacteria bacterium]|nr:hypothetical protein [Deltaproteobacteria bacterium]